MSRMLRLLVAGSRGFENRVRSDGDLQDAYLIMEHFLDKYYKDVPLLIVHGGARGADSLAELYAEKRGLETKIFLANWDVEGKAAGPIRNSMMVDFCDEAVCFWDGRSTGTKDTIDKLDRSGKRYRVYRGWEPFDYRPVTKR